MGRSIICLFRLVFRVAVYLICIFLAGERIFLIRVICLWFWIDQTIKLRSVKMLYLKWSYLWSRKMHSSGAYQGFHTQKMQFKSLNMLPTFLSGNVLVGFCPWAVWHSVHTHTKLIVDMWNLLTCYIDYYIREARMSMNRPSTRKVLDNLIYNYSPTFCGKAG